MIDARTVEQIVHRYRELRLLDEIALREVARLLAPSHPLTRVVAVSESLHLHVKVEDAALLPRAALASIGGRAENEASGYLKLAHPDAGVNVIFSSIPIAEEDRIANLPAPPRPFLDHLWLDVRTETADTIALFDEVPALARRLAWGHVAQGGAGAPVSCCQAQVSAKHWLFPRESASGPGARPIEIALGPLRITEGTMGSDLRPIDPAHARAREVVSCCAAEPALPTTTPTIALRAKPRTTRT